MSETVLYSPEPDQDVRVASWWSDLVKSGELVDIFAPNVQSLSAFLHMFQLPTQLYYRVDDKGIRAAVWFEPMLSGAFVGMWIRPNLRRTRDSVLFLRDTILEASNHVNVLIGLTKQADVVFLAQKLGFQNMGGISGLLPGGITYLLVKETDFSRRNGTQVEVSSQPRQLVY